MLKKIYKDILSNRLLTGILLIGILIRLIFFLRAYEIIPISSDEAWPGLMAKHILDGEFPVVYWGQSYMGTVESFFQAIFIYLFGTIPFSVRVYPLLVGILFIFVTFKIADEMYNRGVALIAASLVSIPTVYLSICTSMVPPDNYLATALIGSSAILLLHRVIYKPISEDEKMRYHILLGFLSGLGFWIHILYIDYIALILLFFFIHDKLIFLRKRFWAFVLFFTIGSLPLILYNITHSFDTFMVARGVGLRKAFENLLMLFRDVLPQLLGVKIPLYGDNWNTLSLPEHWGLALGAVYIIAFLYIIVTRWKNILGFLTFSLKKIGPTEMLLAFIIISIFVFIRSERANDWAVRYILPVFSVVPVLLSYVIYGIGRRYKSVAGVMLGIVMVMQLYGNGRLYAAWGMPEIVEKALDLPDDRPLITFLDSKGITRAYAHYWISYRMTYETGERIICAQPYDERFAGRFKPRYTDEVASSGNVTYVLYERLGIPPPEFEKSLKKIGGSYTKEIIGPFTVFYNFRPPHVEIPGKGWIVKSNYNSRDASLAIDGDIRTRWGSSHPRVKGMNFEIEIPRPYLLNKIEIRLGGFTLDYPETIDLDVSEDGIRWKRVVFTTHMEDILRWDQGQPRYFFGHEAVVLYHLFQPVKARFVRLNQTGSHPVFDWSIPEISLYGPAGGWH